MDRHLLLLHGALADENQLGFLEEALRDSAKIHKLTFVGHGRDSHNESRFAMDLFAGQIVDFVKNLGAETDVFAYSMGGYAALLAAHGYSGLGKIVTLGTKFDWNPSTSQREVQFLNPDVMIEKIPQYAARLEQIHGARWKTVVGKTADMMLDLGQNAPLHAKTLSEIKNKVLILVGDQDMTAGVEASRKAAMLIPHASFAVLDKTQHPLEKTNPAVLTDRIRKFMLES